MADKTLIHCITGQRRLHRVHDVALCSPSQAHPYVYCGLSQTIVDCHTYYLRMFARHKALDHMLWYAQRVPVWAKDKSLVFVVPDVQKSWLSEEDVTSIVDAWSCVPSGIPVLVVPGTPCAGVCRQDIVGHALTAGTASPVHPDWVHSFSRKVPDSLDGETSRWTYDRL